MKDRAEALAERLRLGGDLCAIDPKHRKKLDKANVILRHYPEARVLCGNCGHNYLKYAEDHLHGIWEGENIVCKWKPPKRRRRKGK